MEVKASSDPGSTTRLGLGMWLENIGWVSAGGENYIKDMAPVLLFNLNLLW